MAISDTVVAMVAAVGSTQAAAAEAQSKALDAVRSQIEEKLASREANWASAQLAATTQYDATTADITELKAQFKELGGVFARKARTPKESKEGDDSGNNDSLVDAVARVLADSKEAMSPTDICAAVEAAGYESKSSENFRTMVGGALTKLKAASTGRGKNKVWIVNNEVRGQWEAGPGMKAYIKDLEAETVSQA